MKNPFGNKKKTKSTKTNASTQSKNKNSSATTKGANPAKGPTVETHGFEYDATVDNSVNDPSNSKSKLKSSSSSSNSEFNTSSWYSIEGRIGRVKFLAYNIFLGLLLIIPLLLFIMLSGGINAIALELEMGRGVVGLPFLISMLFMVPTFIYAIIILPLRRLHDINKSGKWLLLYLVPFANLMLLYWIYLKKGDEGENQYGLKPPPNTTVEKVLAAIMPVLFVVGIAATIYSSTFVTPATIDEHQTITNVKPVQTELNDPNNKRIKNQPNASSANEINLKDKITSNKQIEGADVSKTKQESVNGLILNEEDSIRMAEQNQIEGNANPSLIITEEPINTNQPVKSEETVSALNTAATESASSGNLNAEDTIIESAGSQINSADNQNDQGDDQSIKNENEVEKTYDEFLEASEKPILIDRRSSK